MSTRRDVVAERQLLALALSGHPTLVERFLGLPLGVWAPPHEPVATVLRDRMRRGIPIDPGTVAADTATAVGTDEQAEQARRLVLDLATNAPPAESWDYYADEVLLAYAVRTTAESAERLAGQVENADNARDVASVVHTTTDDLTAAVEQMTPTAAEPPMSLQALLDEPEQSYDWLVPGLWERGDRVMITGYEGTGKSHLLAQCALTVAAGLHPFTGDPHRPEGARVLVIDCENSRHQVRRRYATIAGQVDAIRHEHQQPGVDWSQQVRLVIQPDGIDLADPRTYARLERAIAATAPDLVLAGPLYRLHRMNINDEQAARELVEALDRLRVKYRFALLCEAHVGHVGETVGGRRLRPTGSSLFLRWPEFGYGLRADSTAQGEEHPSLVEVVAWRGSRDERSWPTKLCHDAARRLPWKPPDLDYLGQVADDLHEATPARHMHAV